MQTPEEQERIELARLEKHIFGGSSAAMPRPPQQWKWKQQQAAVLTAPPVSPAKPLDWSRAKTPPEPADAIQQPTPRNPPMTSATSTTTESRRGAMMAPRLSLGPSSFVCAMRTTQPPPNYGAPMPRQPQPPAVSYSSSYLMKPSSIPTTQQHQQQQYRGIDHLTTAMTTTPKQHQPRMSMQYYGGSGNGAKEVDDRIWANKQTVAAISPWRQQQPPQQQQPKEETKPKEEPKPMQLTTTTTTVETKKEEEKTEAVVVKAAAVEPPTTTPETTATTDANKDDGEKQKKKKKHKKTKEDEGVDEEGKKKKKKTHKKKKEDVKEGEETTATTTEEKKHHKKKKKALEDTTTTPTTATTMTEETEKKHHKKKKKTAETTEETTTAAATTTKKKKKAKKTTTEEGGEQKHHHHKHKESQPPAPQAQPTIATTPTALVVMTTTPTTAESDQSTKREIAELAKALEIAEHHRRTSSETTPPKPQPPLSTTTTTSSTHSSGRGKKMCAACLKDITTKHFMCMGKPFHIECLVCSKCNKHVSSFCQSSSNGKMYCVDCFHEINPVRKCDRCGGSIPSMSVVAGGKHFHQQCFTCAMCSKIIKEDFVEQDGKVFCGKECYQKMCAKHCFVCHLVLDSVYLTVLNQTYHKHCFQCASCSKPFATLDYFAVNNSPLCESCALKKL